MNIYQIAEKAGVSIATVSRVLNNSPAVSEKTRQKVLEIIEQDHYHPNIFARGLMLDSMKLVGVICTDVSDIFIAQTLSVLQAQLRNRGYDTLLFCVGSNQETTTKHLRYLQNKHVDAIFLIGSAFSETVNQEKLSKIALKIPVIMVNSFINVSGVYCVCSDDTGAVAEVTDLLCKRNLTNCIMLYDSMTQGTKRKIEGLKKGLLKNGIEMQESRLVFAGESLLDSMQTLEELILKDKIPDAVIATSDVLAAGAIKAFAKYNIKRSVIGFDNTIICECLVPSLTSIDLNIEKTCAKAVGILDKITENQTPKQINLCKAKIIWRESFVK